MSYLTGQRVQSHDGKHGTVTRDAADHRSVYVLWDGSDTARWELPECVKPLEKQPGTSARDAWISGDGRLKGKAR